MNNKKFPYWLLLLVPAAGIATYKLFRNMARGINRTTESIDNSKNQALKFFEYFGVVVTNLTVFATPVVSTTTKNLIAYLAMNIDDWNVVQDTFTSLCGGNYTIFQAASTALISQNYSVFSDYITIALSQKRIFCQNDSYSLRNVNQYGGVIAETFLKGDFVGRCQREDDTYYYYISINTGETYAVEKSNFYLK